MTGSRGHGVHGIRITGSQGHGNHGATGVTGVTGRVTGVSPKSMTRGDSGCRQSTLTTLFGVTTRKQTPAEVEEDPH